MGEIKKLAGATAYYGLSSILGRVLNYLLVPIYTRVFLPEEYGVVAYIYSLAALFNVIMTYGMETSYFRFVNKHEGKQADVQNTAFTALMISTSLFLVLGFLFYQPLTCLNDFGDNYQYILFFFVITALDTYAVIPFARLRQQNKAKKYALIRLSSIILNIVLNLALILLLPALSKGGHLTFLPEWLRNPSIDSIFVANVLSSALVLLLLLPDMMRFRLRLDKFLLREMLWYSFPILIAGLAGVINETMDRVFLKYLLPEDIADYQIGIYGACYKLAVFMTLFIQAFRLGAEPFFFSHAKQKDAPKTYAEVMKYFAIFVSAIYLGVMSNIGWLDEFIGRNFRVGLDIVPIILLANLCLGLYLNLSLWYKLTDMTRWGAYISIFGAVITIVIAVVFIPRYGYIAAAWATLAAYAGMMIVSYFTGQKYYPIPYKTGKISAYILSAVALSLVGWYVLDRSILYGNILFIAYVAVVLYLEKGIVLSFIKKIK